MPPGSRFKQRRKEVRRVLIYLYNGCHYCDSLNLFRVSKESGIDKDTLYNIFRSGINGRNNKGKIISALEELELFVWRKLNGLETKQREGDGIQTEVLEEMHEVKEVHRLREDKGIRKTKDEKVRIMRQEKKDMGSESKGEKDTTDSSIDETFID